MIDAGDFNGDSHDDILWQNDNGQAGVWLMNGTNVIGGGTVGPNPGPSWHVIGAGDFNGDSHDDILWQNDNGQAAIWLMNGTNVTRRRAGLRSAAVLHHGPRRRLARCRRRRRQCRPWSFASSGVVGVSARQKPRRRASESL